MAEAVSPKRCAATVKLRVSATLAKTSKALRLRIVKALLLTAIQYCFSFYRIDLLLISS